ncbi:MAG: DUF4091 domain-containing protein [Clostridia bacterium]|nr:DUF4091 domain-containing protein [Clostridia bacterium]
MQNKALETFILSSEEKVFYDTRPTESVRSLQIFSNETCYFTYTYRSNEKCCIPISVSVSAKDIPISVFRIDNVSVAHTDSGFDEVASEGRAPGSFPDILLERKALPEIGKTDCGRLPFYEKDEKILLNATNDATKALLIGINEDGKALSAGEYTVTVAARSLFDGKTVAENTLSLTVLPAALPKIDFYYTNWVHYDCIADIHGAEIWSDGYFNILSSYLKCAAKYGMTLLLTPTFTPALDTHVGGERMKAQLVGIERKDGVYTFDFTLLERFVETAKAAGFERFEHPHLFTQWGAEHAPNIYVNENGREVHAFGWDTDASGEEYKSFLKQYIPAIKNEAKALGIELFWHISDEPTPEVELTYKRAKNALGDLLDGERSGDALSDIRFYNEGLVKTPAVSIDYVYKFFGKCEHLWAYYTGGYYANHTTQRFTNRLITDKPYRTRIGGLHFYKYKLEGFLHWGYNYYYDRMSKGIVDPKLDPCGYKNLPGASFIVYPWLGGCAPSLRSVYMKNSLTDLRALKLLEGFIGYDNVIKLCDEFFGEEISAETMPKSADEMLRFREMINCEILKYVK